MIEIDEAIKRILAKCRPLEAVVQRTVSSLGMVLAEDVQADVDSPPHNKSIVDGFAIRVEDAGKTLRVVEQVVAGQVPRFSVSVGTASHVMTGAPIPDGAEAMVMVEEVELVGDAVRMPNSVRLGQNIMPRARSFAKGQLVLERGTLIRPIEVGLLCEVGRSSVRCIPRPSIAVLPTGDELVCSDTIPEAGQIRNSNGPMLEARSVAAGCEVHSLGIGRDNEADLKSKIETGLESDILLLSGGVSAGARDLVPPTLAALGVDEVFHKVNLKPGKPLWFGAIERGGRVSLVFGLPGNPISSLVCFELFVYSAIQVLAGRSAKIEMRSAVLAETFHQTGNRPTYYPGRRLGGGVEARVEPLAWMGSADILTVSRADCLIYFGAEKKEYIAGDQVTVLPLDR